MKANIVEWHELNKEAASRITEGQPSTATLSSWAHRSFAFASLSQMILRIIKFLCRTEISYTLSHHLSFSSHLCLQLFLTRTIHIV